MASYKIDYIFILKNIWLGWAAVNDPNKELFSAHLTPDKSCFFIPIPRENPEMRALLLSIPSALRRKREELKNFQQTNRVLFIEPEVGEEPPARGLPPDPTTNSYAEFTNFYDGTYGTIGPSNQTWTFPAATMPGGLTDVDVTGNFIRLPNEKFGPVQLPTNSNIFIYHPNFVWAHTWNIVSKALDGDNVVVTFDDMPAPPPPPSNFLYPSPLVFN